MKILYSIYLYFRATMFMLICLPVMILISLFSPSSIYRVGQLVAKGVFWCFNIKYEIIGILPEDVPYIFMHNHTSFLDLFFLPMIIKGKYTGVVASKNFKIPLIGRILKQIKAIPITRSNLTDAIRSIKVAEKRLNQGYHIAIFPEGTRTITGQLNPFKKGGFHMALNTNTNIVPIAVKGLFNIKPKTRWTINKGKAVMIIGHPINVKGKTVDELILEMLNFYKGHDLLLDTSMSNNR